MKKKEKEKEKKAGKDDWGTKGCVGEQQQQQQQNKQNQTKVKNISIKRREITYAF